MNDPFMLRRLPTILILLALMASTALAEEAGALLDKTGVRRGICVVLGDATCELAADLARRSELIVYTQVPTIGAADAARRTLDKAGLLNRRVYVEAGPLRRVALADNLADVLIAVGGAATGDSAIPRAEAIRVLVPGGKAIVGNRAFTKPFPDGLDDWTHPYHGPDNNPRSRDRFARWPYRTQFFAAPRYGPAPAVTLISRGRLLTFYGHIAWHEREEDLRNTLVAVSACNGTRLWQRKLAAGFMVHRNTMAATGDAVYYGEGGVCMILDAATGRKRTEVPAPQAAVQAEAPHWKWLALEGGVLYGVFGKPEQPDKAQLWRRASGGWPWTAMSEGFNDAKRIWGNGRVVAAVDPATKRPLWTHTEAEPIDTRAVCMGEGKLFLFSFGAYLTALDTKTGRPLWRKTPENAPKLFEAIGEYRDKQGWATNWKTAVYLKCTDKALYFAGPQVTKLLAVSTDDGRHLWENPYDNFQLVVYDEFLYGVSGNRQPVSRKLHPLTGKVLKELKVHRHGCTRPTGTVDSVFFRAGGGTVRHDLATDRSVLLSPMRPSCHDGVVIGNGMTYWMPWVCDCNLTMFGISALAHARQTDAAPGPRRHVTDAAPTDSPIGLRDWPTYRANNARRAVSRATVPAGATKLWEFVPKSPGRPTAPVAAYGRIYFASDDGVVRAIDARTGRPQWAFPTGGAIPAPPSIWNGRALVGSADGWVYCLDAHSGRLVWRFRAAPAERRIPVYGKLSSTWPAASGVLVQEGVAYVAAGIVNYDGTYVYALDAATGQVKWRNTDSGYVDNEWRSGASVQGHLLLHAGKLWMPGGNVVSPASYDLADGAYLGAAPKQLGSRAPRGSELLLGPDGMVHVTGQPLYNTPEDATLSRGHFIQTFHARSGGREIAWVNDSQVLCFDKPDLFNGKAFRGWWRRDRKPIKPPEAKPLWRHPCRGSDALAVAANAVVVATGRTIAVTGKVAEGTPKKIAALSLTDGKVMWTHDLPAPPLRWGLAIDRDGRTVVALQNGRVVCFAAK